MKDQKQKISKGNREIVAKTPKATSNLTSFSLPVWLGLLLVLVIGSIIYSNSFSCGFHLDDPTWIVNNNKIRNLSDLSAAWREDQSRFFSYYTFAINYHYGELNVWGYHLVNLLIHLANSILVYWLSTLILSTPILNESEVSKHKKGIAIFAALLFVSHPLATQSVTYIVQRMASLAALFYLLSIALYVKARLSKSNHLMRYLLFGGAAISTVLAIFSKENAYTIPFAVVLSEICFFQKKINLSFFKNYKIIVVIAALLGFIGYIINRFSFSILKPIPRDYANDFQIVTVQNYLLTQFSVIVKYIQLLVLPINQNLDYDYPLSNSIFEAKTFGSLVILLAILIFGIYKFNQNRLLSFGILWFFLTLSIESSIIPISDVIFEHRTYLPSFGFFLIASAAFFRLIYSKNQNFALLFATFIIVTFSYLTYQRNLVWQNETTLWSDVVLKSPNKARGHFNLGVALNDNKNYKQAVQSYTKAINLKPFHDQAFSNRGIIYMDEGKNAEAMADFNKAISLDPKRERVYVNRGKLLFNLKQNEASLLDFNKAIELNPKMAEAYYNRAIIFGEQGKYEEARADYTEAIKLNPKNEEAYNNRGNVFVKEKRYQEALQDFSKAIELNPKYVQAYNNRSNVYINQKMYREGIPDLLKAIEIKPDLAIAYANLGMTEYKLGEMDKACKDLKKAIELGFQPATDLYTKICK
ncbi:MAG: tetratricopeptide repeat protein [Saprospiraceae bacterium]